MVDESEVLFADEIVGKDDLFEDTLVVTATDELFMTEAAVWLAVVLLVPEVGFLFNAAAVVVEACVLLSI